MHKYKFGNFTLITNNHLDADTSVFSKFLAMAISSLLEDGSLYYKSQFVYPTSIEQYQGHLLDPCNVLNVGGNIYTIRDLNLGKV